MRMTNVIALSIKSTLFIEILRSLNVEAWFSIEYSRRRANFRDWEKPSDFSGMHSAQGNLILHPALPSAVEYCKMHER